MSDIETRETLLRAAWACAKARPCFYCAAACLCLNQPVLTVKPGFAWYCESEEDVWLCESHYFEKMQEQWDPRIPFAFSVRVLKDSEGGGFLAYHPQFPGTYCGDGETPEGAVNGLADCVRIIDERD